MSITDVEKFLLKCKIAVKFNTIFVFSEKNKQTLTALGYQKDDVFNEILDLQAQDYVLGPLKDDQGYAGDFWVFGKIIQCQEIYIKVKVKNLNSEGDKQLSCLCISFHFAEHPLVFPFR